MKARNIIVLALVITMVGFIAAPPPASASLIGLTVALVIAFAGTVAVTQTVRLEKTKSAAKAEAQQAAEQANLEKSEVAVESP